MAQRHEGGAEHHRARAPEEPVSHEAAEDRREIDQAGVLAGDEQAQLQRRARPEEMLDGGPDGADAHHVADVLRLEQVLGQVQGQQDLHAVVREPFPQLAGREPGEAEGMAQESGVVA